MMERVILTVGFGTYYIIKNILVNDNLYESIRLTDFQIQTSNHLF